MGLPPPLLSPEQQQNPGCYAAKCGWCQCNRHIQGMVIWKLRWVLAFTACGETQLRKISSSLENVRVTLRVYKAVPDTGNAAGDLLMGQRNSHWYFYIYEALLGDEMLIISSATLRDCCAMLVQDWLLKVMLPAI